MAALAYVERQNISAMQHTWRRTLASWTSLKISDEDKEKIEEAVNEKISWLEENQDAEGEDYRVQKKELEDVVQPIIARLYQQGGGPPPEGEPEDEEDFKDEL